MKQSVRKATLATLTLALALVFLTDTTAQAQIVKTYSTGDLFKKKREKKEAEKKAQADACQDTVNLSINFANTLVDLQKQVPALVYQGGLSQTVPSKVNSLTKKLQGVLPDSDNLVEEAQFLETSLHSCRDRGFGHLNEAGYKILEGTQSDLDAAIGSALDKIDAASDETQKLVAVGGKEESIFVDAAPKKVNPKNAAKASEQVQQSKQTLAALRNVLTLVPALSDKYSSRIDALESKYAAVDTKVGEVKDQFFASPFHKEHVNSIVFSNTVLKPGSEASGYKETIVAGQPFAITVLTDKPFREVTSYSAGTLNFYIGTQFVAGLNVRPMGGDDVRKTGYNSVQVLYGSINENVDKYSGDRLKNLTKFLRQFARLTPKVHQMTVKYMPDYSNKAILEGEVAFDCTQLVPGDANVLNKLAADMEQEVQERAEDKYLSGFEFKNKLANSSLRAKVQKHLVEMGEGQVKRSKVFFTDNLWTVVTNEYGVNMYRRIAFEYLLEDTQGNYYAGFSTVAQDPLTNGSFDTSQTEPTSDILEPDGKGGQQLRTDYSQYRSGSAWGQRIVSKDKVAKYMN